MDDSFVLLFGNLEHRSHDFAAFIFEQYFSLAHCLVAGPPRTAVEIFSCPSCVSWLIQLPILQVRERFALYVKDIASTNDQALPSLNLIGSIGTWKRGTVVTSFGLP